MSRRATSWLAWSLLALCVVLTIAALVLYSLAHWRQLEGVDTIGLFGGVGILVFPVVGVLVASRRPENPIGWLMLGIGVIGAVTAFSNGYALYGVVAHPGSLPAVDVVTVFGLPGSALGFLLAGTFLLLLFPDGHLPSRRWRWVARLSALMLGIGLLGFLLRPGPIDSLRAVDNPIGLGGSAGAAVGWVDNALFVAFLLCVPLSATSVGVRFRRSSGVERQQLRWIAAAAALFGVALLSGPFFFWWMPFSGVWDVLMPLSIASFPVAVGFAILRYRLYDLDRIVNRTVVYAILTAGLAGLYFGIVIALQQIFGSFTRGNDLAIAGSTLAVAALFRPARRRIQELVDRRFYRRRYDAQQTLEAFSTRLRDEVDLDQLGTDLGTVVHETMQPAHISLWLRPQEAER